MTVRLQSKVFVACVSIITLSTAVSYFYARAQLLSNDGDNAVALVRRGAMLGFLVGTLCAVVASFVVARWNSRTARSLTVAADRMAAGDLSARARVNGLDEFAKLGAAVDQVAENFSITLQQLRSERDRLDTVLSGMAEGVLLLDRDGRVALVNPALRAMSLIGTAVEGKAPIEVIRNVELSALLERARESKVPVSSELELTTAAASRVLVRTRPLASKEGGLVAVFVDVTELRRLETLRRDFVANASHELRTPIASIHSAAETLISGAGDQPESRARFMDIITRNAARLNQLVRDMLDLSRLESRGFILTLRSTAPLGVVQQVFNTLGNDAAHKGITLKAELPEDLRVLADAGVLEQILMNLVDNAIKYCPASSHVLVRHKSAENQVQLIVSDDGRGIDAKHLPRLFERFYRVDAGRSRDVGGTGLGLAIVKHLAEAMNGAVAVESELGNGTSFIVRLPGA